MELVAAVGAEATQSGGREPSSSGEEGLVGRKRARVGSDGDLKRVAEIVLVLSGMGAMRGGRRPTEVERELMAEARDRLALMCEGIAPKDIVPRDAVRVVIDDLGLDRSNDQRLAFRPPKMSISEKLQLTKRKMEESKKFNTQSAIYSSQMLSGGFGAKAESHVSKGPFNSHGDRDSSSFSLPRTEATHFRLDGTSNALSYSSQGKAMSSGDPSLERTPTYSPHVQSGVVAKVGLSNKVSDHKVGGTAEISTPQVAFQASTDRNLHPVPTQTSSGNLQSFHQPSPARNYVSVASLYNNHNDIAKNVQKFLQPRPSEQPNWTPPSTDYMNKSLTCQICKITINDVESLLVCDACEKGVHLKCLQSYNQKGIPKLEWHCPKCLISSNGKPLPPKYGRVTRSITLPKVFPSTTGGIQVSSEKPENPDHKVSHQNVTTNGKTDSLNSAPVDHGGSSHTETVSDPKVAKPSTLPGAPYSASDRKMEDDSISESKPHQNENNGVVSAPPAETLKEGSNQCVQNGDSSTCDPDRSELKSNSPPKLESGYSCPDKLSDTSAEVDPAKTLNPTAVSSSQCSEVKKSDLGENGDSNPQLGNDDKGIGNSHLSNGVTDLKSTLGGLHSVEWIGDVHQLMDEKAFYKSCNINGRVYKLDDFALFRSSSGVLRPSKLQVLWEDTNTGSKWAVVNRCYFPADLPEVVGRPCTPETDEVYESNHGSTIMAGLIQGPCEVFPPNKFKEESERRIDLHYKGNDGLPPIFLCKWFYDESKVLFRLVTD